MQIAAAPRRPAAHNGAVDILRLLAALGIVWFHSQAMGNRIAYLALPFFLVLLGMPSASPLLQRARRLLQPFVIWSLIYGALHSLQALRRGEPPLGWFQPSDLLTGTSIHLWFLPFALLGTLLFRLLPDPRVALALPVLAAGLVVALPAVETTPFAQWLFGIVPLTLGYCWFRNGWATVLPWAASAAILFAGRDHPDNVTIALGTALAIVLLQIRLPRSSFSDRCARLAMLVFLGHMVPMHIGWTLGLSGLSLAGSALAGALALALALDALRGRRLGRLLA